MSYVDSTTANSNSTTVKSVAVPAGVQADDIIIIAMTTDATGNVDSGHYPPDFVELAEIDLTHDGQLFVVAWKRATGNDTGTYQFQINVGGSNWVYQAIVLRGRHTTNPPTVSTNSSNAANTPPVTVSAATVTALDGDDLVWISAPDVNTNGAGNTHTVPSGYTKQEDDENAFSNLCMATKENVSAGATGSVDGTFALTSGTSGWGAVLVRVPSVSTGGVVNEQTLSSTLAVTDEGLDYVFFSRLASSSVNLFDELVASLVLSGSAIQTKVLESLVLMSDGAISTQIRNRLLQDTIIISEGTTEQYVTTNLLLEDVVEISDQIARFCRFFRVGSDTLTVADSLLSSFINYLIATSVLTSNLTVTDEASSSYVFARFLDSFLTVEDESISQFMRFILLTDALSVNDGVIATYVPDGGPPGQVFDATIRIGFDQPKFSLGGYALN